MLNISWSGLGPGASLENSCAMEDAGSGTASRLGPTTSSNAWSTSFFLFRVALFC